MMVEIKEIQANQISGSVLAFTDDPGTRDALGRLMDGGYMQPPDIRSGGIAEALDLIQFDTDAIVVDISTSTDPVGDIADLVQRSGKHVVAVGTLNDVSVYRSILQAGAADYLVMPVTDEVLVDALSKRAPPPSADEPEPLGCRTNILIGVRGGLGTSTLAVNTAWLLAEEFGLETALVDLDLNFGTGPLSLDLLPGRGLREAIEHPERIDSLFVGSAMINATDKLFVLGSEEPLDRELYASGAAINQMLVAIQQNFSSMVIDLPRTMVPAQLNLLSNASSVILVSDMSIAGLRDTLRLKTLLTDNAPQSAITIVAMEAATGKSPMSKKEFEKGIDGKVDILVPYDAKLTASAANQGKALAKVAGKRHPLVKAVRSVAMRCGEPQDGKSERKSIWRF